MKDNSNQLPGENIEVVEPPSDVDAEIKRLAALSQLEYEHERKEAAQRLGVRTGILDKLVQAERGGDDSDLQGDEIVLADPEPWPHPVNGADLLDQLAASISEYLILPTGADVVIALWVLHCHSVDAFYYTPRLDIQSPTKGCGKTTLLDWLEAVSPRGVRTESATTAVIFRLVHHQKPTLLVDEVDRYIKDSDELIVVVNAGYRRGGQHMRCEGDGNKVRGFHTFGPVALAGIDKLPATIADRSIPIRMRKATKDEAQRLKRFRADRADDERILCRMAARWTADNFDQIAAYEPETPDWMFNRQAEIWRTLFAVADMAGGEWPQLARETATMMAKTDGGEEETAVQALMDIRDLFAERDTDRLSSEDIANALVLIEGRPWAEWGRVQKPMSKNALARLLSRFDIRPNSVRLDTGQNAKGYTLNQFSEAFGSYIVADPLIATVTPSQPAETLGFSEIPTVTTNSAVTVANALKPALSNDCDGVTVAEGVIGANAQNDGEIGWYDKDDIEREAIMDEENFRG